MKIVSWNVNGLRAVLTKGFDESITALNADAICLQETKLQAGQTDYCPAGYEAYWNYAEKKGYSGTVIFTRVKPLSVTYGIGIPQHDTEGRVITMEFDDFYLVCCYTPNSQRDLKRIDYRMSWEDDFRSYLKQLDAKKPVVLTGDLNVAHEEIDLKNPSTNHHSAGFSDEERGKFSELLSSGFTDSFRHFYPDRKDAYTWWSYIGHTRERNVGWRIDYFVVSDRLTDRLISSEICPDIYGSDHCPVELVL